MIKLTVGFPLFKARNIGWLGMESLCNQRNIPFEWELVVAEETNPKLMPMGKDAIYSYRERLWKAGCCRIQYIPLKNHIKLNVKWKELAVNSSGGSEILLLQDADCYSQPYRLVQTYELMRKDNLDWLNNYKGLFYIINDGQMATYCAKTVWSGLDYAVYTELVRNIKPVPARMPTGMCKILFHDCEVAKGSPLKVGFNESIDVWKSVNTHGANLMMKHREKQIRDSSGPYNIIDGDIREYVPEYIAKRLERMKKE